MVAWASTGRPCVRNIFPVSAAGNGVRPWAVSKNKPSNWSVWLAGSLVGASNSFDSTISFEGRLAFVGDDGGLTHPASMDSVRAERNGLRKALKNYRGS